MVDWIASPFLVANFRDRWLFNSLVSPMRFVLSPLLDPTLENFFFPGRQRKIAIRRRHLQIWIIGENSIDQLSIGTAFDIKSKICLTLIRIGTMTGETVLRKNRLDVKVVRNFLRQSFISANRRCNYDQSDRHKYRCNSNFHGKQDNALPSLDAASILT